MPPVSVRAPAVIVFVEENVPEAPSVVVYVPEIPSPALRVISIVSVEKAVSPDAVVAASLIFTGSSTFTSP